MLLSPPTISAYAEIVSFYFAASDLYLYIRKAALGLVARTGLPLAVNPPL